MYIYIYQFKAGFLKQLSLAELCTHVLELGMGFEPFLFFCGACSHYRNKRAKSCALRLRHVILDVWFTCGKNQHNKSITHVASGASANCWHFLTAMCSIPKCSYVFPLPWCLLEAVQRQHPTPLAQSFTSHANIVDI